MTAIPGNDSIEQRVGEEWIGALMEKDYQRLADICQPEVRSRLMTPKRFDAFENVSDLTAKVEKWFHECVSFQREQTRIALVGEKLAIFYRLQVENHEHRSTIEQQIYCTLRDGRIDQLNLLCSGFQPVQEVTKAPMAQAMNEQAGPPASPQADAFLKVQTSGEQGSACAILTPSIKRKLGELSSGQVLAVQVDDPSAKEDIEAWCRLSGNALLNLEPVADQELRFYLMKK